MAKYVTTLLPCLQGRSLPRKDSETTWFEPEEMNEGEADTSINAHRYGQNHLILAGKGGRPAILGAGGAEGIRTPDPHNAIVVLYQLSYDPNQRRGGTLVSRSGLSKHFAGGRARPRKLSRSPQSFSPPCASPQAKIAATNCAQFHRLT